MFSHVDAMTLKKGMKFNNILVKEAVKQWQQFLLGYFSRSIACDGIFGNQTEQYTIQFQKENFLVGDGIVGPITIAKAISLGYGKFIDNDHDKMGPSWPEKPQDVKILTQYEKTKIFGEIKYKHVPIEGSFENIKITNDWVSKYITKVNVPQLKNVTGAPKSCDVFINKLIANNFLELWKTWEKINKLDLVITWAGSWVPRLIRGSTTTLSSHAWGTAFDINAAWNMMGKRPALVNEKGSVRELVESAVDHGFFWMGWYEGRPDGMHFEWFRPF